MENVLLVGADPVALRKERDRLGASGVRVIACDAGKFWMSGARQCAKVVMLEEHAHVRKAYEGTDIPIEVMGAPEPEAEKPAPTPESADDEPPADLVTEASTKAAPKPKRTG